MLPGAFCGLVSLETLDLSKNKLATIPQLLPVKPSLKYLSLEENRLQHVPVDYFRGFEVLRNVYIGYNELYSLPNMGYVGHSLRLFAIDGNKLQTLDGRLTGGLEMTILEDLDVQNNEISHFDVTILQQMPRIHVLNLAGNQLQHMADPTAYLHSLNAGLRLRLNLDLNPLTCDKGLAWLLVLAEEEKLDGGVRNRVLCHRPTCLKGRDVMSLSKYVELTISYDNV